jgi:hypothetical protein
MRKAGWIALGGAVLVAALLIPSFAGASPSAPANASNTFRWKPSVHSTTGTNTITVVCPPGKKKGHAKDTRVVAKVTYGTGPGVAEKRTTTFDVTWLTGTTTIDAPPPHTGSDSSPNLARMFFPCDRDESYWKFQPRFGFDKTGQARWVLVHYVRVAS